MRILHVPFCYYADPVGGTEVYVAQLAQAQRRLGCQAMVAAPGDAHAAYEHNGISVRRFPVSPVGDLKELYGGGDRRAAEDFGRILDECRPDIVHLHAFTRAVSIHFVRQAKRRGLPVVFNYHTPTVSCMRGTLLRWGSSICDGLIHRRACASCTLHGKGLSRSLSRLAASIPPSVGRTLGHVGFSGGPWTVLRMSELVGVRIRALQEFMGAIDHIVALCDWTRELLIRNGVPAAKITLCRHGIEPPPVHSTRPVRPGGAPILAAFLGRLDSTKGAHIVVRSLRDCPDLPFQLDLYGVRQGQASDRYASELEALIAGDSRIRILPPLRESEVVPRLRAYDVLVVPSQCLETGPLVALEAFAAGIPVMGSKLGGIAEMVRHEVDGLLVEPADSPQSWAAMLQRLCARPDLLASLGSGARPPRRTDEEARDLLRICTGLLYGGWKPAEAVLG